MAAKIDWYYHRPGCITCQRALQFLTDAQLKVTEQVNARQTRFSPAEAVELARKADHVVIAKGKKVVEFDMLKAPPTDEELTPHLIGPSGFFRAPAIRQGKTLYIGFHPEEFAPRLTKSSRK